MSRRPDTNTRNLEILRAIGDGVEVSSEIFVHSSYEAVHTIRQSCLKMTKEGLLRSDMRFIKRPPGVISAWTHGSRAHHFALTDLGRERLAELEESASPAIEIQA